LNLKFKLTYKYQVWIPAITTATAQGHNGCLEHLLIHTHTGKQAHAGQEASSSDVHASLLDSFL
jgi:hypothetical protein